jgi:hypothetical protein
VNQLFKVIVFIVGGILGMAAGSFIFDWCSDHPLQTKGVAAKDPVIEQTNGGTGYPAEVLSISKNSTSFQKAVAVEKTRSLKGKPVTVVGIVSDVSLNVFSGKPCILLQNPSNNREQTRIYVDLVEKEEWKAARLMINDVILVEGVYEGLCDIAASGNYMTDILANKITMWGK